MIFVLLVSAGLVWLELSNFDKKIKDLKKRSDEMDKKIREQEEFLKHLNDI